uniref:Uncharacterized protein n=1 Tax=Arundo donax TaxID=35708 RepID=A0A0A9AT68_ARUDO
MILCLCLSSSNFQMV